MALDQDQITGQIVDVAYKMHVQLGPGLLEDRVVVELKVPIGLLINFGAGTLKEGLHRIVNQLQPSATSPLAVNRPLPTETGPSLPGEGPER